jgi:AcrR family transcriptional regulator
MVGVMGRPREHTEATRADLVAAARRLLAENGPAGLELRGLAAHVDTTTRAIYSLFGSKENLARALYVDGFAELVGRLQAIRRGGDPRVDLLAACFAYREQARGQPVLYRLMCEQLVPEFTPTCDDRAHALQALHLLADLLAACRDAGIVALPHPAEPAGPDPARRRRMPPLEVDTEVDLLARQWWAMLHGLAALEIRGFLGNPEDADRVWQASLTALLDTPVPADRR